MDGIVLRLAVHKAYDRCWEERVFKQHLYALAVIAAVVASPGCEDTRCGDGTFEQDGVCVWTPPPGSDDACGDGTHFDPVTFTCVPDYPPTVCDPETTVEIVDPATGVTYCVSPGDEACSETFLCPTPRDGKVTLCGQLLNVSTNAHERVDQAISELCDPGNPTEDGPCSLQMAVYDAVDFSTNREMAVPLEATRIQIDDCGRFRVDSVAYPVQAPFVAISVRGVSSTDVWAHAAAFVEVTPNLRRTDLRLYALEQSADAAWTSSAGDPFAGDSFVDRGAYVSLFMSGEPVLDGWDPDQNVHKRVAGVSVTAAGAPVGDSAYYFSDTDPNVLSTIDDGMTATGANGAAITVDTSLVNHSGSGAEPPGCEWPRNLAASVPGVAVIHERIAVDSTTGDVCE